MQPNCRFSLSRSLHIPLKCAKPLMRRGATTLNSKWIKFESNCISLHSTHKHRYNLCVCLCVFTSFSFCFIYFDQSNLISFINKASCFCLFKWLCLFDCAHSTKERRWYVNKAHRPTQDKGMKKIIIIIIVIVIRVVKQTQTPPHRNRIVQWPIKLEIRCCCIICRAICVCAVPSPSLVRSLSLCHASFFPSSFVAVPFHCYSVINNVYEFRIFSLSLV